MIHAMAIGVAHGLAIHEHDSDTGHNPTIFAREQSGKMPYLLVELDDQPEAKAEPATELRVDSTDSRSARLMLTSPRHGFAYEVSVDGQLLRRHNTRLSAMVKSKRCICETSRHQSPQMKRTKSRSSH